MNQEPIFQAYRGRFAPSPTGPLHFGSLVAAVGSYLEARSRHGEWLVRIENLDPSREIPGASKEILSTLEILGMEWDGEVVYQSRRNEAYQAALILLKNKNLIYPCVCSRKEIADSSITGIDGPIYPRTCHRGLPDTERLQALRVRTDNNPIEIKDVLRGLVRQRLESDIGDFVLRRADGIFAYQLAVVVDDAEQGVTHVVRGEDLLNSTPRQVYLQQLLGYPTPVYMHLPVVVNTLGEKLSKQTHAAPIVTADPVSQLIMAIRFLGRKPPAELAEGDVASFWKWATKNWKPEMIP
ncbi:glutamyl-Q tRNA(Asp) synthetase [Nitrosospira sp. Nsp5]|uniref:Glutamyl-Q tRNA(Asp) synthetase n=1 Tax=Nitrosospira multiformis TaxID=1231 RepID=A0ABY0TJD8_9PROT|nr:MULTISPECIES: tRNA glutamyl-Q(34) synthetase GluQRS [Nitrosospira]PTR10294.1 glutamyl-Q tRNA(Asp) synthetase [Nitrosospira sp. Nsp5]SDQ93093.1 glutamyl-Q tRNA(Asp) synthetase [Nitrosospira multiformis]